MSENELLFSLFFVSCRSKNKVEQPMIKDFDLLQRANNDYTTIDLEHAEELAYRELIDSIRYIPLGDECGVMGNIANIITYKGRFYIQEEQFDRVFIYDDTGRCLITWFNQDYMRNVIHAHEKYRFYRYKYGKRGTDAR